MTKRFDRYADKDEKDSITDDGIQQFYTELGVDTQVKIQQYCRNCTSLVALLSWSPTCG